MQPNFTKIQGFEVLSFEGVELTQKRGNENVPIENGTLLVLFFQENVHFILSLNNWSYCLLKRLPVTSSSRTNMKTRTYALPSEDGLYNLKISNIPHPEAIQNFETILEHCTSLSYQEEKGGNHGVHHTHKDKSSLEVIGEYLKEAAYRKFTSSTTVKKTVTKMANKVTRVFFKANQHNMNLTQVKDFESLKTVDSRSLNRHEYSKQEVEDVTVKSKEFTEKLLSVVENSTISEKKDINIFHQTNTVVEIKDEESIMTEIMRIIEKQEKARKMQDQYREQEYVYRLKERELRDLLQEKIAKRELIEIRYTEQTFQSEITQREKLLQQQEELRKIEKMEFEQREKDLLQEIERRMTELRAKEKLTEEEHLEYKRKGETYLSITETRQTQNQEFERTKMKIVEEVKQREMELEKREQMTQEQRMELVKKEETIKQTIKQELDVLKNKEKLTFEEKKVLKQKEKELLKIVKLNEAEKKKFEREQKKAQLQLNIEYRRLMEQEKLTEEERIEFRKKEAEYTEITEKRLHEIERKEQIMEIERVQLDKRKREFAKITELVNIEKQELMVNKKTMRTELKLHEEAIHSNQMLIEVERIRLHEITNDLLKIKELTEAKKAFIEQQRESIMEEIQRREMIIQKKEGLIVGARMSLERKKEDAEREISKYHMLLEERQRSLVEERKALAIREEKLVKTTQIEMRTNQEIREELLAIKEQKERIAMVGQKLLMDEELMQERIHNFLTEMSEAVLGIKVRTETQSYASSSRTEESSVHFESNTAQTLQQDMASFG